MNMIPQNIQVILATDPTMPGNDWTERIPQCGCLITPIAGCFPYFLNFDMILDIVGLEKPSSSTAQAPALRAPTICPFSNTVRLRILT